MIILQNYLLYFGIAEHFLPKRKTLIDKQPLTSETAKVILNATLVQ